MIISLQLEIRIQMNGYRNSSSSSKALVGSCCLPLLLTFGICLSIVLVTQNKRRMRRRGRWQPTKRFLPVLVCNWTYGLVSGNRGAEVHNKKALPRSSSYSRKIGAPSTTHSEAHGKRVALCPAAVC